MTTSDFLDWIKPGVSFQQNHSTTSMEHLACAGNHERDWPNTGDRFLEENAMDSGGECGVIAEKRIPMPIPHAGEQ